MSDPSSQVLTVPESLRGVLLHDFLARVFPGAERAALRGMLARGQVRVNGMAAARNVRLGPHDCVELCSDPAALALHPGRGRQLDLRVLFESQHVLVVDKPAGEPTVPARSGRESSVHSRLVTLRPAADLRIVHRLDKGTSGCLILAKGLAAARHFDTAFRGGTVHKEYVALVHGTVRPAVQVVELFLGPDRARPGKVKASPSPGKGMRAAATTVQVAAHYSRFTLLRLQPATGRGHQLRVHLAAIGHPIVGDADYGGRPLLLSELKPRYKLRAGVDERPLLARPFLHAAVVRFADLDGSPVAVEAPLPDDLQMALHKVEHFCRSRER